MSLLLGSRISGPVGRGGTNLPKDVSLVQELINKYLPPPLRPLTVDGRCGLMTIRAIEEIQRRFLHMNPPDGKVAINGATIRFLTGGAPPKPNHNANTFPKEIIAAAQASEKTSKIPASVTLAQWALESNWGKKVPPGSNNPFGIKAKGTEPYVEIPTHEVVHGKSILVKAKFRKFTSLTDAFEQHGQLLATASPYAHARTLIGKPDDFADALTGVYATDPDYGAKLKRIMKAHNLYRYN